MVTNSDHDCIISSIQTKTHGLHTYIKVWNRGGFAGTLCMNKEDADEIVRRLQFKLGGVAQPSNMDQSYSQEKFSSAYLHWVREQDESS